MNAPGDSAPCGSYRQWAIALLLTTPLALHAQQPLEEIVVTATKREASLDDTAMSVAVLSGQELENSGAADLHDYWRTVASLVVTDQGFAGDRITIRGLGEEPNGITESMSAVYFGETPVSQADGLFTMAPNLQLVDMARVEVLRGPQGTLFGANSMGGALRLIPNSPEMGESTQAVSGLVSSTAHGGSNFGGTVMLNQPLGEASALRLAGYWFDEDGFIDDIGSQRADINSEQTRGLRLAWAADLTPRLSVQANVALQNREAGGFAFVDPVGKPSLALGTEGRYQVALLSDQFRQADTQLASLRVAFNGERADWVSVTSWVNYEQALQIDLGEEAQFFFGDYASLYSTTGYDQSTLIQELRASSPAHSALQWLGGLFYLDQDTPRQDRFFLFDQQINQVVATNKRRDLGLFGEVAVALGERLTATAGLRWFDISKSQIAVENGLFTNFSDVATALDYSETGWSPKLSLDWAVGNNTLLYALASRGFRPGGGNTPLTVTQCQAAPAYQSDKLWNYEAGFRTTLPDTPMRVSASVYTIDWSDAQVQIQPDDCINVFIVNAGQASSDGLELELEGKIGDSLHLRAAASYNRSKVDRAPAASGITGGSDVPLVPDTVLSLAGTWNFRIRQQEAFARLDWQYTGRTQTSLFAQQNVTQDSYHLLNLRLGTNLGRWTATVFADNLLDERASLVCCRIDGGFTINRPRTVGVRVVVEL